MPAIPALRSQSSRGRWLFLGCIATDLRLAATPYLKTIGMVNSTLLTVVRRRRRRRKRLGNGRMGGGALKRSKAERRGSTGTQRRQETVPRETTLSGSFSLVAHSRTGA